MAPLMLPYFEETVAAVLRRELDRASGVTTCSQITDLCDLIRQLLLEFFSWKYDSLSNIRVVVERLNGVLINDLKSLFSITTSDCDLDQVTELVCRHSETMRAFSIIDFRVNIAAKLLLQTHKRQFFYSCSKKISGILGALARANSYTNSRNEYNASVFVEVLRLAAESWADLKRFKDAPCFQHITIDFRRKFVYYFERYFRQIVDKGIVILPIGFVAVLLENACFLERQFKIVFELENQHNSVPFPGAAALYNIERAVRNISDCLVSYFSRKYISEVAQIVRAADSKKFSVKELLETKFKAVFQTIKSLKEPWNKQLLRVFFQKLLEGYTEMVSIQGSEFSTTAYFLDHLGQFKTVFESLKNSGDDYESYAQFLDLYVAFLSTQSHSRCQMALSVMKTILETELPDDCINRIIDSKNYSKCRFTAKQLSTFFHATMAEQRTGQKLIARRAAARHWFIDKLIFGMRCWRFLKNLKITTKQAQKHGPLRPPRMTLVDLKQVLFDAKLSEFKRECRFISIKRKELKDFSKQRLFDFIKDQVMGQSREDVFLKFDGRLVTITDSRQNLLRTLFPAKITGVDRVSGVNHRAIVFHYGPIERIILAIDKIETQNFLFEQLSAVSDTFSALSFNKEW